MRDPLYQLEAAADEREVAVRADEAVEAGGRERRPAMSSARIAGHAATKCRPVVTGCASAASILLQLL